MPGSMRSRCRHTKFQRRRRSPTARWNGTRPRLVYVEVQAGGQTGIGFTYADVATAKLIETLLRETSWAKTRCRLARVGTTCTESYAQSRARRHYLHGDLRGRRCAVGSQRQDPWSPDLRAAWGRSARACRSMGAADLLRIRRTQLCEQLAGWCAAGIPRVKMKIGRDPKADIERVAAAARRAIGDDAELFVDANGAYGVAAGDRVRHTILPSNA